MTNDVNRSTQRYHVSSLYDENGQVAPHFVNDEFRSFCVTWDQAMADPGFAEIIAIELQAEKVADKPLGHLAALAPSQRVRALYAEWLAFIDGQLEPWTTGGAIHFRQHWARVLMHALAIGDALGLPDTDLRCLAMAAVFHDSRRASPYLDTGHGARAAGYYAECCKKRGNVRGVLPSAESAMPAAGVRQERANADSPENANSAAGPQLVFDPRTLLAVAWHDRDDKDGLAAVERAVDTGHIPGASGLGYEEALPHGAQADAATILRIFKDADGIDRVRLGPNGLDERFLRTDQAKQLVPFAHELLAASNSPQDE